MPALHFCFLTASPLRLYRQEQLSNARLCRIHIASVGLHRDVSLSQQTSKHISIVKCRC
jgi:hypothetical protein